MKKGKHNAIIPQKSAASPQEAETRGGWETSFQSALGVAGNRPWPLPPPATTPLLITRNLLNSQPLIFLPESRSRPISTITALKLSVSSKRSFRTSPKKSPQNLPACRLVELNHLKWREAAPLLLMASI